MASPTKYQSKPDPRLVTPNYKANPLTFIQETGQGTQSKPVPPKRVVFERQLLPPPTPANAPGAGGTI
jgi:hypothetical protein